MPYRTTKSLAVLTCILLLQTACDDDTATATAGPTSGAGATGGSGQGGAGVGGGSGGSGGSGDLDIGVCDPQNGALSLTIDNPYFPLVVGTKLTLESTDALLEITVLNETHDVAGVTTRVLEERETENGELIEVSRNYFAQASDGTVCYYGEDVDIYENGMVSSHEGAWLADFSTNFPGIIMPADPMVGMTYQQEVAPGIAMDRGEILSVGEPYTVPFMTYDDTVGTVDTSPLEPGAESEKVYARDVGLIYDDGVALTNVTTM